MQHLDEGTMHSWLDGALSPEEAARVEAHVKECPECAAAVAEARGFIAASSRILTALDNAPRGVIPAAPQIRRRNWAAWRAAAAVLVVAVGSLVVLRNSGDEQVKLFETPEKNSVQHPVPPVVIRANPAGATAATTATQGPIDARAQEGSALSARSTVGNAAVAPSAKSPTLSSTSGAEKNGSRMAREGMARDQGKALAARGVTAAPVPVRAPTLAPSALAGAVAMDAAAEPEQLKVVGTPRRIGGRVTLYEVGLGDTVTLTESLPVSLQGVVTTGAAAGAVSPQGARRMAAQAPARTDAAAPAAGEKQRAASVPSSAAAVSAPAPPSAFGTGSTVNTISWNDPATGATLTLSGRISTARLQEIKIRIERERAAAAAKKNP